MRSQTPYPYLGTLIKDVNALTWERVEPPWLHLQRNRALNMRMYRISRITYRLSTTNKKQFKGFPLLYKDSGVQANKSFAISLIGITQGNTNLNPDPNPNPNPKVNPSLNPNPNVNPKPNPNLWARLRLGTSLICSDWSSDGHTFQLLVLPEEIKHLQCRVV